MPQKMKKKVLKCSSKQKKTWTNVHNEYDLRSPAIKSKKLKKSKKSKKCQKCQKYKRIKKVHEATLAIITFNFEM